MTDAMEIAKNRRQECVDKIKQLETEIEHLREDIEDLDTFLEFGSSLIGEEKARPTSRIPSKPAPVNTPELREVKDEEPEAEEADDPADAIANVLAARKG